MTGLRRRNVLYAILLAALLAVIVASYQGFKTATALPEKPLSELLTALEPTQVVTGTFDSGDARVDWTDDHGQVYRTFYPTGYEAVLVDRFHQNQLTIVARQSAAANVWLTVVLPT
jgi:hypothetical protein